MHDASLLDIMHPLPVSSLTTIALYWTYFSYLYVKIHLLD